MVDSLKGAINETLKKYPNSGNKEIYALIKWALEGNYNYFSKSNGARKYIYESSKNNKILDELKMGSDYIDLDQIIKNYIEKNFNEEVLIKDSKEEFIKTLKENEDIGKIEHRIRYLSTISLDDTDFAHKIWDNFSEIFIGNDSNISDLNLKYYLILNAINKMDRYSNLKKRDFDINNLTLRDTLSIINIFALNNDLEGLIKLLNTNSNLSGILIEDLINDIVNKDNDNFKILDNMLRNYDNLNDKSNLIYQTLIGNNLLDMDHDKLLGLLLQNSLLMNMYNKEDKYLLYKENSDTKLEYIENRIKTNDAIINLLVNQSNINLEKLNSSIASFDDKILNFLSNMYVISRSNESNIEKLNDALFCGNDKQVLVYKLLESGKINLNKKVA